MSVDIMNKKSVVGGCNDVDEFRYLLWCQCRLCFYSLPKYIEVLGLCKLVVPRNIHSACAQLKEN